MDIADLVDNCKAALNLIQEGTSKAYRAAGYEPRTGSIAEKEIASTKNREILLTAYDQGGVLIEVVADESAAFAKTLINPVQTIAPWSIARSIIESAALGCWLLDPGIDEITRIARSYALRYEGLIQQERYARSEKDDQIADAALERIRKVETQALGLGYPPIHNKGGKCIGIGQQMPSMTLIVDLTLHKQGIYRLLSAAVHAHFWAIKNLGFDLMDNASVPAGADNQAGVKVHLMQKAMQPMPILGVTAEVLSCFARLVWNKFILFGWDGTEFATTLEAAYDILGMTQRFWKGS